MVEEEDIAQLGTSIGNYRLDKILGRGGMGTVYSGEHIYIKRPVAVKILHPQFAPTRRRSTGSCPRRARRRQSTT